MGLTLVGIQQPRPARQQRHEVHRPPDHDLSPAHLHLGMSVLRLSPPALADLVLGSIQHDVLQLWRRWKLGGVKPAVDLLGYRCPGDHYRRDTLEYLACPQRYHR